MSTAFDPFDPELLWGDTTTYSERQKRCREAYIDLVYTDWLPAPRHNWLFPRDGFVTGDAASLLATRIYNIITQSRSFYQEDGLAAGGFGHILDRGGDAELWTLIRISLEEARVTEFADIVREWKS